VNLERLLELQIFYFLEVVLDIQANHLIRQVLEEQLVLCHSVEKILEILFEKRGGKFLEFLDFIVDELAEKNFVTFLSFLYIAKVLVIAEEINVFKGVGVGLFVEDHGKVGDFDYVEVLLALHHVILFLRGVK